MKEITLKNAAQALNGAHPSEASGSKPPPLALLDFVCRRQPGWGLLAQYEQARLTGKRST